MTELIFLKLGGSLLTDKTGFELIREEVLARLALEIKSALNIRPGLLLLVGHGSGSFGHVAAAKHGTRTGVRTAGQWRGFAEVSNAAARLNSRVLEALVQAKVPALTFQPSASAVCQNGKIVSMHLDPIQKALTKGLVPVVYGDVAIDLVLGGTIISTEEIMAYFARKILPSAILLAGETDGVLDADGALIPRIDQRQQGISPASLSGSRGTDVTGGMASKVEGMLSLTSKLPSLQVRIFSGLVPGAVRDCLLDPGTHLGTVIGGD